MFGLFSIIQLINLDFYLKLRNTRQPIFIVRWKQNLLIMKVLEYSYRVHKKSGKIKREKGTKSFQLKFIKVNFIKVLSKNYIIFIFPY